MMDQTRNANSMLSRRQNRHAMNHFDLDFHFAYCFLKLVANMRFQLGICSFILDNVYRQVFSALLDYLKLFDFSLQGIKDFSKIVGKDVLLVRRDNQITQSTFEIAQHRQSSAAWASMRGDNSHIPKLVANKRHGVVM